MPNTNVRQKYKVCLNTNTSLHYTTMLLLLGATSIVDLWAFRLIVDRITSVVVFAVLPPFSATTSVYSVDMLGPQAT
jgi:hypothetical protein